MYDLLQLEKRDLFALNPFQLRKKGMVLGVIFAKGMDSIPIQCQHNKLKKILDNGVKVFEAALEGGETHLVNLGQIQKDPLSGSILHISLHKLEKNQTTGFSVPIKLEGEARGAKEGGVLRQLLDKVTVTGLPRNIPESITVDVGSLGVSDQLTLENIVLDKGLSFEEGEDLTRPIAACSVPKLSPESSAETAGASDEETKGQEGPEGNDKDQDKGKGKDGEKGRSDGGKEAA
ncbi:MAG: 50S ribosomal protein L25 [Bacteriovoracales bacterium]|nr:50S ribosomal protein L25 [Bacteriovoracales bacterium]